MADGLGLAIGIASLLLELYTKCKNSSAEFHHLHLDLKSFHQTLSLNACYLLRLHDSRIACEELVAEIARLISKHESQSSWRRLKLSFEDIQPLRTRINLQISALHASVSMLQYRDRLADLRSVARSTRSARSLGVVTNHDHDFGHDDHCYVPKRTATNKSPGSFEVNTQGNATTPVSTFDLCSDTISLPASTESLVSTQMAQDRLSLQSSNTSSSTSTAQTEQSWSLACFEPQGSYSGAGFTGASGEQNLVTLCNSFLEVNEEPTNIALIAVSSIDIGPQGRVEQGQNTLWQNASAVYTDSEFLRPPLIWAIVAGRKDLVELYVKKQELIEARDGVWDWTSLMWAVMEEQSAILEVLIRNGADLTAVDSKFHRTPLLWAASIGNRIAAELFLSRKVEKKRELLDVTDKDGMTPLALAYFEGHMGLAQLFVDSGANVDFKFASGSSLLSWAILAKNEDFVQLLLEHGADAQSTDMNGTPVLILAIQQNLPYLANLLVIKGADVQSTDEDHIPALTIAVKDRRSDIATMLIHNGADLEAKDGEGNTALLWAVWRNNENLVRLLVKNKAKIAAADGEGVTVRESALWTGNDVIIQLVSLTG